MAGTMAQLQDLDVIASAGASAAATVHDGGSGGAQAGATAVAQAGGATVIASAAATAVVHISESGDDPESTTATPTSPINTSVLVSSSLLTSPTIASTPHPSPASSILSTDHSGSDASTRFPSSNAGSILISRTITGAHEVTIGTLFSTPSPTESTTAPRHESASTASITLYVHPTIR